MLPILVEMLEGTSEENVIVVTNEFKKDFITMRNDRAKGIFCTNLTAPLARRRQASSADITEEDVEAATAAAEATVNSAQVDLLNYLNPYSV